MAIQYSCDCCQTPVAVPNNRGYVIQAQYCDTCVAEIDEYMKSINAIHEEAAALFKLKLEEMKAKFKAEHEKARLPDE